MGNGETCLLSPWMADVCLKHLPSISTEIKTEKHCSYIFTTLQTYRKIVGFFLECIYTLYSKMLHHFCPCFSPSEYSGGCVKEPAVIAHHLVSDYMQYYSFVRYYYITVYHNLHINNLCATAVTHQRNDCTSWGHTHKVVYN